MYRAFRTSALRLGVAAIAAVALLAATANMACADTITSSDFHLAFGASVNGPNVWSTAETAGVNTPTTQGSFVFSAAPVGGKFSDGGPTFANGVPADGAIGSVSGSFAPSVGFAVPITAQYTGAAPSNASSTPNYRLSLEITSLRILASDSVGEGSTAEGYMAWAETTPGHTQQSGWTVTNWDQPIYNLLSYYTQVKWDPADYSVALAEPNASYTRTFTVPFATSGLDFRHGDGLEVFGRVNLIYDSVAVPEPASVLLLLAGVLSLVAYAWRKR